MRVSEPCDGYEKKLFSLDLAYRLGNVILSGETGLVVLQSPLRLTEGFSCYLFGLRESFDLKLVFKVFKSVCFLELNSSVL